MEFYKLLKIYLSTGDTNILNELRKILEKNVNQKQDFIDWLQKECEENMLKKSLSVLESKDIIELLNDLGNKILPDRIDSPYDAKKLCYMLEHVDNIVRKEFIESADIFVIVKLNEYVSNVLNYFYTSPDVGSIRSISRIHYYNSKFSKYINKRLKSYKYQATA